MFCATLVYAASATAQKTSATTAADPGKYHELVRQAVDEYDRGNFEEAKALFTEAYEAFPNARALRGLGMVANELRDYVRAIQYLERAIEHRVRPLDAAMIAEARGIVARARKYIGTVRVSTNPAEATFTVDGWPTERASDGTMMLNPGPHEIAARAPGHQTSTRLVRMEPGATLELEFALQPGIGTEADLRSDALLPAEHPSGEGSKASIAPWIVVGVSAAVAIGGGVLVGLALDDVNTVEDAAPLEEWTRVESEYNRSQTRSTIGILMIAAGVAGAAAGVTWHVLESPSEDLALHVSPVAATLRGRW